MTEAEPDNLNVLGGPLASCCSTKVTGFYRDGYCRTGSQDLGRHVICAIVTDEFLNFSKLRGNDLITPLPMYDFPGLVAGDRWCLCATRWREAHDAGFAPPVDLEATHERALEVVSLETLRLYANAH
ncbi:MAG: DUF2237 domain-containing protein [Pseudomonadota bacterium]